MKSAKCSVLSAQCPVPNGGGRGTRGFTIIETMIVMGIIALLGSILLLAILGVRKTGDVTAEQGMVSALNTSVQQFKNSNGFLPPLVLDVNPGPVDTSDRIHIWSAQELGDKDAPLNGGPSPFGANRFSNYSLAIYLAGALGSDYDGINGLGFTAPSDKRDGQFSRKGKKIEALIDPTQQRTRTGASRLYIPFLNTPSQADSVACIILDRWSDGNVQPTPTSWPIRYYRWLPTYWAHVPNDPNSGKVRYWNVPLAAGGAMISDDPPTKAELKDAEYAIVSAGPNHLFGDETDLAAMRIALGLDTGSAEDEVRRRAAADNIVEVGR